MKGKEILDSFKKKFGKKVKDPVIQQKGKVKYDVLWMTIDRADVLDFCEHLFEFGFPHFAILSGNDFGETVEFVYHFSVGYGERNGEVSVNFKVPVSKKKYALPTICGLFPGALVSEREKQELFGVEIEGIPDDRNLFLKQGFKGFPGIKEDKDVKEKEVE
jgi:Ni,Fe-hydrogenase III component G